MREDIAPCPWCKEKAYTHVNNQPGFSYTVQCSACFAKGPHVKFNPNLARHGPYEGYVEPFIEECIKLWNERTASNGAVNEESGENREGDEPSGTVLAKAS